MKSIISFLIVIVFSLTSYAQESELASTAESQNNIKESKLPAVVIRRVGADLSIYIPEILNQDPKINQIQSEFVAYDLGRNQEGYEEYLVSFTSKDGSLLAKYNENGKLLNVVEKYKNVRIPNEIVNNILKDYAGWTIIKDRYYYSQQDGTIIEKKYDIILEKDNKKKQVVYRPNGELENK